ncbi:(2Fe-2S)-binding protein [Streptomyces ipomoeae]|uniref:Putative carbon-monoxide dehydrogenase (Acceptor), small subunit n=1 Tax=Streptomyces ipomoeae 91-03 TaxID=698759 RepID=L1KQP9_9ACTN|nr:(2Fe-2S)-binding protein [Streptomyces ipomoeae]EKX62708.1 putative carbon-monoxide dehydrogenase (acceptor), small subunit [Streptomyces ipomoeae 91-03]MDX2696615.1 (2Fe-2S)-binding protein [Streptomyces ipomoeae]MDX2824130.1 (2Fe-2S)-binding protein [Streptomyces ipomoeae]MDX2842367.1 (2Fe-2S)-binding protein [Streptomyces ipomoeae]MDX2876761.1 (2Fe-2S)-binding protein [Streptomyces ipomoeae]
MRVNFTVNGRPQEADDVWEGESLLYVLRERLGLPGSKNACEQGECGSCTVRLDGVPVCACLVAAGQVEGREVVTVEGLADYARQRAEGGPHAERGGCGTGACGTSNASAASDTSAASGASGTSAASGTSGASGTSLDEAKRWQAKGADSRTGEGVELSPIQQAFIDAGAVQCGFCTPGLLVAADEMLERHPNPSDADIREALSGNLCRCTGYEKIMDAVRLAAARQSEGV